MVIQGKVLRPLIRGGGYLECLLIRNFNVFVSFPFSSAVFLEQLLYLSL